MIPRNPPTDPTAGWHVRAAGALVSLAIVGLSLQLVGITDSSASRPAALRHARATARVLAPPGHTFADALVSRCYERVLGRAVDPTGLSDWGTALSSGTATVAQVGSGLARSAEFASNQVKASFAQYLHQVPAPAKLSSLVHSILTGTSFEHVRASLLGSSTFFALSGGTDAKFVTSLYVQVDGSPPTPAALASGVSALVHGTTKVALALRLIESTAGLGRLVGSWYAEILGRSASPSEVAGWVGHLRAGMSDQSALAQLVGSHEFISDSSKSLVTHLYESLLGGAPDSAQLAAGSSALLGGSSVNTVASGIAGSRQFADAQVTAYYLYYLHRAPDAGGLATFVTAVLGGSRFEQVRSALLSSTEFYADSGNTDAGFVTGLYQVVLGRSPSPSELSQWVTALQGGATRGAVATDFVASTEGLDDLVQLWYQGFLGRPAAGSELSGWVGALQGASTDQAVIAAILSSPEYQVGSQLP